MIFKAATRSATTLDVGPLSGEGSATPTLSRAVNPSSFRHSLVHEPPAAQSHAAASSTQTLPLVVTWARRVAHIGYAAPVAALVFVLYGGIVWQLLHDWLGDVPGLLGRIVAFAFLVALAPWRHFHPTPARTTLSGLAGVALACAMFLTGQAAADLFVTRVSFVVLLAGLIWTFCGWTRLRATAFLLLFLLSSVPLPLLIGARFVFPIQRVTSDAAVRLAEAANAPLVDDGPVLSMSGLRIEIADVSGTVKLLGPLIVVSWVVAATRCRTWGRRILVVVAAVPVMMGTDVLRIGAMTWMARDSGSMALAFHRWWAPPLMAAVAVGILSAFADGRRPRPAIEGRS